MKLAIKLIPISLDTSFSQSTATFYEDPNSPAAVEFDENVIVNSSNTLVSGRINAKLTFLNPSQISDVMPGDYLASTNSALESFGGISTSLKDDDGNTLNLSAGSTAKLRIPV